jgi:hypothetical protein
MIALMLPATGSTRYAEQRITCVSNMKRLTLALLLYEKEHGKLPEGDWREAIRPYLGANADEYFQCPSHKLAEGYTSYARISDVPNAVSSPMQILIVEVLQPQKLGVGDGRIPFDKATFWQKDETNPNVRRPEGFDGLGSYHWDGINASFRSGAVRFLGEHVPELRKLLDGTATALP